MTTLLIRAQSDERIHNKAAAIPSPQGENMAAAIYSISMAERAWKNPLAKSSYRITYQFVRRDVQQGVVSRLREGMAARKQALQRFSRQKAAIKQKTERTKRG